MNSLAFTIISVLFVALAMSNIQGALVCLKCNVKHCPSAPANCPFGKTTDSCNCCPACYKGPGEACGGSFESGTSAGKCAPGLECQVLPNNLLGRGHCLVPETTSTTQETSTTQQQVSINF